MWWCFPFSAEIRNRLDEPRFDILLSNPILFSIIIVDRVKRRVRKRKSRGASIIMRQVDVREICLSLLLIFLGRYR